MTIQKDNLTCNNIAALPGQYNRPSQATQRVFRVARLYIIRRYSSMHKCITLLHRCKRNSLLTIPVVWNCAHGLESYFTLNIYQVSFATTQAAAQT